MYYKRSAFVTFDGLDAIFLADVDAGFDGLRGGHTDLGLGDSGRLV